MRRRSSSGWRLYAPPGPQGATPAAAANKPPPCRRGARRGPRRGRHRTASRRCPPPSSISRWTVTSRRRLPARQTSWSLPTSGASASPVACPWRARWSLPGGLPGAPMATTLATVLQRLRSVMPQKTLRATSRRLWRSCGGPSRCCRAPVPAAPESPTPLTGARGRPRRPPISRVPSRACSWRSHGWAPRRRSRCRRGRSRHRRPCRRGWPSRTRAPIDCMPSSWRSKICGRLSGC
mmetsp:Transcript_90355/g.251118  ORF Transcript_90355/g.251118 Transcript_90355/m.251118 type:complete len:236 (+) Transcript_90355:369-1076(+)